VYAEARDERVTTSQYPDPRICQVFGYSLRRFRLGFQDANDFWSRDEQALIACPHVTKTFVCVCELFAAHVGAWRALALVWNTALHTWDWQPAVFQLAFEGAIAGSLTRKEKRRIRAALTGCVLGAAIGAV
jgi:hypothetical protein